MANKTRDKFGNPEGTGTQGAEYTFTFTGFIEKSTKPSGSSPASLKLADGRAFVPPELLPEPLRFLLLEMDRILGRERAAALFTTAIDNSKVISQAFEDGTALSCKAAIIELRAGLVPASLRGEYPELCRAIDETWERWPVMRPPLIGGAYGGDSFSVSPSTVTRMPELRYGKYFGVELSSQMSPTLKLLQAREKAMTAQMQRDLAVDLGMTTLPAQSSTSQATERASPTLDDVNRVTMEILAEDIISPWFSYSPGDKITVIQEGLNPDWVGTVRQGPAKPVSASTPLLPINSKRPKFRAKIDPCTPSESAPSK